MYGVVCCAILGEAMCIPGQEGKLGFRVDSLTVGAVFRFGNEHDEHKRAAKRCTQAPFNSPHPLLQSTSQSECRM